MPFTLAHPAIVVPLARTNPRFWVPSALIVGSMTPDFEYFVFLRPIRTIGHDLIGIALMDIPAGLAALWAFQCVMKRPLVLLMPGPIRRQLIGACVPFRFRPAGRLLAIIASLGVGAFSHIAWDAFTHEDGWVVVRCPPLDATVVDGLRAFRALQYGSTLLGLSLLVIWTWCWFRSRVAVAGLIEPGMPRPWRAIALASFVLIPCVAGAMTLLDSAPVGCYRILVRSVIAGISSLFVSMFAVSVAYRAFDPRAW